MSQPVFVKCSTLRWRLFVRGTVVLRINGITLQHTTPKMQTRAVLRIRLPLWPRHGWNYLYGTRDEWLWLIVFQPKSVVDWAERQGFDSYLTLKEPVR